MRNIAISFILLILSTTLSFADNIKELMQKNGCFKCHNIVGIKKAPPFSMIAFRNSSWYMDSLANIKNSIKNGSQGKYPMFLGVKMPSYKNLSEKELSQIASWILSQEKKGVHGCRMMQ